MKNTILISALLFLAISSVAFGQSISIFDIDTTNFPTMKAKFYAYDKDGNQVRPSASELSINEDGVPRTITNVSCPPQKPLQTVSVAMSIDISGSMSQSDFGEIPVELGKLTATTLCNSIAMPPSEFALQTCNDKALIIQDFTKNRDKIIDVINPIKAGGNNNFVEHLLNQITGLLNIAKTGKNKRVAVLYTDAWWGALTPNELKNCIDTCKKYNIEFYTVIYSRPEAEPNGIKSSLKEICKQTEGFLYDGITSKDAAKDIALRIQKVTQGGDPCELTWVSGFQCLTEYINYELNWDSFKLLTTYKQPSKAIAMLEVSPRLISFGKISKPEIIDTTINISAINSDVTVYDIKLKFGSFIFEIINTTFPIIIPNNTSKTLTLRCTPIDSSMNYASFEIVTNLCPIYVSANSGYPGKKMNTPTLKLTHPNGGEVFIAGSDTLITWEGISPNDTCKLEFSNDNGKTWKTLTNEDANLKFKWENIPKKISNNCLIKVKQFKNKFNNNTNDSVQTLSGHTDFVESVSYSPDGLLIASTSQDETIILWNAFTGQIVRKLYGHTDGVKCLSFSPDGKILATGSVDRNIILWDVSTGQIVRKLSGHKAFVSCLSFSPDGKMLASGSLATFNYTDPYTLKLWDVSTGQLIKNLNNDSTSVRTICFSPDGSKLASNSKLTTDNNVLDHVIKLWDVPSGLLTKTLILDTYQANTIKFSPNGSTLAFGTDEGIITIWDVSTWQKIKMLTGHLSSILNISYSPDGSTLASSSGDNTIILWNIETGKLIKTLFGHTFWINSIFFNPNGNTLVSGSYDKTIKIWYLDFEPLQTDQSDAVFSIVAPSPSSKDVDMKECLVGVSKDSLVSEFVLNNGSYSYRVDSVFFTGADASSFSQVSGFPKFMVDSNSSKTVELRFNPSRIGLHQANVHIITQTDTLIQNITGTGIQPTIQIVNDLIDFGKIKVGNRKDTNQVVTIKNIGNAPLPISKIYQDGPNTLDFIDLSKLNNPTLQPNEELKLNLRFSPNEIGRTSGTLMFEHSGVGSPAVVQLFGEGVQPIAQVINNIIDFGQVQVGNEKDTIQALTIQNIGNAPLSITNIYRSGTNNLDFSEINNLKNTTLQPNEELKLDLRFKPSFVGFSKDSIIFEHDGNGSPTSVELIGEGISSGSGGGKASLKLDSIETETSKIVEYPVKLTLSSDIIKSGANAVNFDITYNNTLLYALENYPITNKDGFATLSFKNVPLTTDPIQTLETLRFRTGLGNAIETPLTISNFELLGTTEEIDVTLKDGNLKLTDVCYDGGVRLLNPNSIVSMANISPNPVNSIISIDLNLIEIGNTEVSIYNLLGEKVKTIFSKEITATGSISINSDLSDLSNGQYVVIFTTPTYTERQNVLILK